MQEEIPLPRLQRNIEMAKKKPTGFVAKCQCGEIVGALDYIRTDRKESGFLLGQWLHEGCTILPRFGSTWSSGISTCRCDKNELYAILVAEPDGMSHGPTEDLRSLLKEEPAGWYGTGTGPKVVMLSGDGNHKPLFIWCTSKEPSQSRWVSIID